MTVRLEESNTVGFRLDKFCLRWRRRTPPVSAIDSTRFDSTHLGGGPTDVEWGTDAADVDVDVGTKNQREGVDDDDAYDCEYELEESCCRAH